MRSHCLVAYLTACLATNSALALPIFSPFHAMGPEAHALHPEPPSSHEAADAMHPEPHPSREVLDVMHPEPHLSHEATDAMHPEPHPSYEAPDAMHPEPHPSREVPDAMHPTTDVHKGPDAVAHPAFDIARPPPAAGGPPPSAVRSRDPPRTYIGTTRLPFAKPAGQPASTKRGCTTIYPTLRTAAFAPPPYLVTVNSSAGVELGFSVPEGAVGSCNLMVNLPTTMTGAGQVNVVALDGPAPGSLVGTTNFQPGAQATINSFACRSQMCYSFQLVGGNGGGVEELSFMEEQGEGVYMTYGC